MNIKRFLVDWAGNYVFFVPIVILFNGYSWHWSWSVIAPYMVSSLALAAVTGRLFIVFLGRVWYPLWRERF